MSSTLQLSLFGSPTLTLSDGRAIALGGQGGLLAARLALEGPQARALLAGLLWPEAGDARARANLRQLLLRLKTLAGADWIEGDAMLSLAPTVQLAQSDEGSLLDGIGAPASAELSRWLDSARDTQRQQRLKSLAAAMAQAQAEQRLDDALALAQRRLALEPLAEAHHRDLVRLHYLNHDHARALAAAERLRQMLAQEFGATPSAETQALLHLIGAAQAPSAQATSAVTASVATPKSPRVPAALLRPPRLLGRDQPLAALTAQLHPGRVALISGEGGLGKSRLLAEALHTLAADGPHDRASLAIGARLGDAAVPYALAVRLLAELPPRVDAEVLASLQTDLAPLRPDAQSGAQTHAGSDLTPRLVAAMQALLGSAAQRGLRALALDDLHLADAASIDLIAALAGACPCALLLAYRPAEAGEALRELVAQLEARADTVSLSLQPLDAASVASLLDSLAQEGVGGLHPRDSVAAGEQALSLHRHTGGNPLYLLETLKAAREQPGADSAASADGPTRWPHAPNVLRLIEQRLKRLSPLALKVARCAAVAGADTSPALVARLLGMSPLDLAEAWAELDQAQVLQARRFAHDLIAEAVRAALPDAVAQPLHAEVAAQLAAAQAEPARVAAHWLAAHEPLQAVPYLRAAAARAKTLWRRREACELLHQAAAILHEAGQHEAAFDPLFDALEAGTDLGEHAFVQGCAPLMSALAAAAPNAATQTAEAFVLSWLRQHAGDTDGALGIAQAALPMASLAPARVEVLLLQTMNVMYWDTRKVREALDVAERALARIAVAEGNAGPPQDSFTPPGGGSGADRPWGHSQGNAGPGDAQAPTHMRLVLSANAGMAACALAHYAQGCSRIEEAWQIAVRQHDVGEVSYSTRLLAVIMMFRGDVQAARLWGERAMEAMRASDQLGTTQEVFALSARMHALTAEGVLGAALAAADRVAELQAQQPIGLLLFNAEERAMLLQELGRRDLARASVPPPEPGAEITDVQRARRAAARASLGLATPAEIDHLLHEAATTADFNLRARLLWMAQPGVAPARIEPLLAEAAALALAHGGLGLWAMLQSRRLAALRALKDPARAAEARQIALDLWELIEQGRSGMETYPRMASEICATLAPTDPALTETMALRAGSWMLRAAATLPPGWRENYLARAPLLDVMPPHERGVLTALGIASLPVAG